MKVILGDIKLAEKALSQILLAQVDVKLAYRVEKITRKLVTEIDKIETKRLEFIGKFGTPDLDNGKDVGRSSVKPDRQAEFNKEFGEYLSGESDIDCQEIPYELLENSGIKMSPADMLLLKKFIAEPISK